MLLPFYDMIRAKENDKTVQDEPRENEVTESEAPYPTLGICHVHEIYFYTSGSLCFSRSVSYETFACRPTSISCLREPKISCNGRQGVTKNLRPRQDCMWASQKTDFRWVKNNFRGHDISQPTS